MINELAYWNARTYGSAIRLKRRWLRLAAVLFCLATPCTNWMLPFLGRVIRSDLIYRF